MLHKLHNFNQNQKFSIAKIKPGSAMLSRFNTFRSELFTDLISAACWLSWTLFCSSLPVLFFGTLFLLHCCIRSPTAFLHILWPRSCQRDHEVPTPTPSADSARLGQGSCCICLPLWSPYVSSVRRDCRVVFAIPTSLSESFRCIRPDVVFVQMW